MPAPWRTEQPGAYCELPAGSSAAPGTATPTLHSISPLPITTCLLPPHRNPSRCCAAWTCMWVPAASASLTTSASCQMARQTPTGGWLLLFLLLFLLLLRGPVPHCPRHPHPATIRSLGCCPRTAAVPAGPAAPAVPACLAVSASTSSPLLPCRPVCCLQGSDPHRLGV